MLLLTLVLMYMSLTQSLLPKSIYDCPLNNLLLLLSYQKKFSLFIQVKYAQSYCFFVVVFLFAGKINAEFLLNPN